MWTIALLMPIFFLGNFRSSSWASLTQSTHEKPIPNTFQNVWQSLERRGLDIDLNEEYVPTPLASPRPNDAQQNKSKYTDSVLHPVQSRPSKAFKKEYRFIPRKKIGSHPENKATKRYRELMQSLHINNPKKHEEILKKKREKSRKALEEIKKDEKKYNEFKRVRNAPRDELRRKAKLGILMDEEERQRYKQIKERDRISQIRSRSTNRRNSIQQKVHSHTATEDEIAEYNKYRENQSA